MIEDFASIKSQFQKYFENKKAFFNENQKVTLASSLLQIFSGKSVKLYDSLKNAFNDMRITTANPHSKLYKFKFSKISLQSDPFFVFYPYYLLDLLKTD